MVQQLKLYKKVPLVYLSHILVATSVTTFVMYPVLPEFLQSEFDRYVENLITVGESIQNKLDSLSDDIISLLKWAHRDQTIYPYDPCTDSKLKQRIKLEQMNRATD